VFFTVKPLALWKQFDSLELGLQILAISHSINR